MENWYSKQKVMEKLWNVAEPVHNIWLMLCDNERRLLRQRVWGCCEWLRLLWDGRHLVGDNKKTTVILMTGQSAVNNKLVNCNKNMEQLGMEKPTNIFLESHWKVIEFHFEVSAQTLIIVNLCNHVCHKLLSAFNYMFDPLGFKTTVTDCSLSVTEILVLLQIVCSI